ncbi:MAG: hypothetical protein WA021_05700 [Minisyncoccia bacterium]
MVDENIAKIREHLARLRAWETVAIVLGAIIFLLAAFVYFRGPHIHPFIFAALGGGCVVAAVIVRFGIGDALNIARETGTNAPPSSTDRQ